ncbi:hypothetical protein CBS101457_005422 [Exobasidium rhododendri]|nr:hypothetical protein CBS101457_005422 [Exobasidium rhododendri]
MIQVSIAPWSLLLLAVAVAAIVITSSKWFRRQDLPPGPPGIPIFGNALQLPTSRPWLFFTQLGKKYGPITYLNIAGQPTIVLNTMEAAKEILVKRSMRYSSRPRLVVGGDYISMGHRLVLMPSTDPRFKLHRGAFHRFVSPNAIRAWGVSQFAESTVTIKGLISLGQVDHQVGKEHHSVLDTMKRYSASVITTVTYGFRVPTGKEAEIVGMNEVHDRFLLSSNPGQNLVDAFPILDYLPGFLSPWRKDALEQQATNKRVYGDLIRRTLSEKNHKALAAESFAAKLSEENTDLDDLDKAFLCGSAFEAGTDTTANALTTFVLAMCTHVSVYEKLKKHVDACCGQSSPTFEEFEALDYVRAVVKETLRWRTVTAGGVPHSSVSDQDDEYMGYRIPAGCTVFANHWGILLDEKHFPEPDVFKPERWLPGGANEDNNLSDLTEGHVAFGFGRRTCPGAGLAVRSLFLVIARAAYFLEILPAKDHTYETQSFSAGFNIGPLAFPVTFRARAGREKILEEDYTEALSSFGAAVV